MAAQPQLLPPREPARTGFKLKIPRLRWVIAIMLSFAALINYVDRQALAVVSLEVRSEFGMTEVDYSHLVVLFMVAYAIMYAGSGYLIDRLGTRRGFAVFIAGWSVAEMLHGLASGKWSLGVYRAMLGLTEPAAWPAAAKAIGEWFPPAQRAMGMGIFNAGSSIGSAVAGPLIAFLAIGFGWRFSFVIAGLMGLVWMLFWLLLYQPPHKSRWITSKEYTELKGKVLTPEQAKPASKGVNWREVVRKRACWVLILARFFTDPVIYFVIFWLPEYLRLERGFDLAMVGRYAWVPFAFGYLGYMVGGWLSMRFIRNGRSLLSSRKAVMLVGASFLPVAILAPFAPSAGLAIAATCFVTFGHAIWVSNLQTLPIDLFDGNEIGTATGFSGSGGAIGGALAALGTGWLVQNFSYAPVFLLAGLMHPLAAGLVYWLLPEKYSRTQKPALKMA